MSDTPTQPDQQPEDQLTEEQLASFLQKTKPPARLTVVDDVYYERDSGDPLHNQTKFYRWLETDDQPWIRELTVGPDWKKLDFGWMANGSMLIIKNIEGKYTQVNRSDAEKAELALRVIQVGILPFEADEKSRTMHSISKSAIYPVPFAMVRPGQSIRFEPIYLERMVLRCLSQAAKIQINILPN